MFSLARVIVIVPLVSSSDFLGIIGNLKTAHVNVLAIKLQCQKLFSLYLRYKNSAD